ncbi:hypothetical protein SDC9_175106 [bioreactor metagenome]|uniref:Uncharacterized protein n=1 Tax=bioreactor metagenome TaxID=1076179 RepID=A0A645GP40_9ZZZZ
MDAPLWMVVSTEEEVFAEERRFSVLALTVPTPRLTSAAKAEPAKTHTESAATREILTAFAFM